MPHKQEIGNLALRIERAYCAAERRESPRGARRWFAREARVHPVTVQRWLSGESPFAGSTAERVLELLEERAGLR